MITRRVESPSLVSFLRVAFFLSRELNHNSVQSMELSVRERRSWHMCAGDEAEDGEITHTLHEGKQISEMVSQSLPQKRKKRAMKLSTVLNALEAQRLNLVLKSNGCI
ncbi:unnamed protein product [Timema podura]|uniref:Uncharacterized protein n=1 Tax=Timema podura TaxID=61482 RepID=A0ABN7P6M6_TIMPD|nr:unnamed protein product [Timema podura]